jgi:hypothetical protein
LGCQLELQRINVFGNKVASSMFSVPPSGNSASAGVDAIIGTLSLWLTVLTFFFLSFQNVISSPEIKKQEIRKQQRREEDKGYKDGLVRGRCLRARPRGHQAQEGRRGGRRRRWRRRRRGGEKGRGRGECVVMM